MGFACFALCKLRLNLPPLLISLREELKASESRYQAQRRVTQALQMELLQLYSRLEMEAPAAAAAASSAGDATERCCPTQTRYGYRFQSASDILLDGLKERIPTHLEEILFLRCFVFGEFHHHMYNTNTIESLLLTFYKIVSLLSHGFSVWRHQMDQ